MCVDKRHWEVLSLHTSCHRFQKLITCLKRASHLFDQAERTWHILGGWAAESSPLCMLGIHKWISTDSLAITFSVDAEFLVLLTCLLGRLLVDRQPCVGFYSHAEDQTGSRSHSIKAEFLPAAMARPSLLEGRIIFIVLIGRTARTTTSLSLD